MIKCILEQEYDTNDKDEAMTLFLNDVSDGSINIEFKGVDEADYNNPFNLESDDGTPIWRDGSAYHSRSKH